MTETLTRTPGARKQPFKYRDFDGIQLTNRARYALLLGGVETVAQLEQMTERDLMKLQNLGARSLADIKQGLSAIGKKLKRSPGPNNRETLTWTPAATKPDADISVLCWRDTGEWFSGWYDDQAGAWFDCASGGIVDGVTHWAEPRAPA